MRNIITFYLKETPNSDGRWLRELWAWSDKDWELEHGFIQWLFPLDEPSMFNPDAPVLGADAIGAWHKDKLLQAQLAEVLRTLAPILRHRKGRWQPPSCCSEAECVGRIQSQLP